MVPLAFALGGGVAGCSAEQTGSGNTGGTGSSAAGSSAMNTGGAGVVSAAGASSNPGGASAGAPTNPGGGGAPSGSAGSASGGSGTTSAGTAGIGTGGSGSGGTGTGTGTGTIGTGGGLTAADGLLVLPGEGTGFTALWTSMPYAFGSWFTYMFHAGATIVPNGPIVTSGAKMCATLAGTAQAAGGGAIGFKVCGAPKYPNELGDSTFFPLACPAAPSCIESEVAKPYSSCGGSIAGVSFIGSAIAKVAFLDAADALIMEFNPPSPTGGFVAAPAGSGASIAAIHFKSFSDGEFCLSQVALKVE